MLVTPRGLITGGDATTAGRRQRRPHRVLRLQQRPGASNGVETAITEPITGRVETPAQQFTINGTASTTTGTVNRVELSVLDRDTGRYLAGRPDHLGRLQHDQHHARHTRCRRRPTGRCR